jgi:hypothetical protein
MQAHTNESEIISLEDRLRIEALRDPVLEAVGHLPGSAYCRRYYLPILGPSSLLCAELLAEWLADQPDGYEVDVAFLGAALGLPGKGGRSPSIARTLDRLTRFGLARHHPDHSLYRVRLAWPPLSRRQLAHLPPPLAILHPAN